LSNARQFLTVLKKIELAVCFAAFAIMTLVLMIDVASREIFGVGWYGSSQRATFAMVVVVFIALGLATADGRHLRPRFADNVLPKSWEPFILRLADLISAAFYLFVAVVAVGVVQVTFDLEERTSTLLWLVWPFQTAMVFAFGLGAIRHVLYFAYPELRPKETGAEQELLQDQDGRGPSA